MCLVGVIVRRYIDFLILLIPAPLVSALFCSSIPTFCSLFYVVRSCQNKIGLIYFYIAFILFERKQWKIIILIFLYSCIAIVYHLYLFIIL